MANERLRDVMDSDERIRENMQRVFEEATDSSSIDVETKTEILKALLEISALAQRAFDVVESNTAFNPSLPHALHLIEQTSERLRMTLANEIIKRDPGAIHMMKRLRDGGML